MKRFSFFLSIVMMLFSSASYAQFTAFTSLNLNFVSSCTFSSTTDGTLAKSAGTESLAQILAPKVSLSWTGNPTVKVDLASMFTGPAGASTSDFAYSIDATSGNGTITFSQSSNGETGSVAALTGSDTISIKNTITKINGNIRGGTYKFKNVVTCS